MVEALVKAGLEIQKKFFGNGGNALIMLTLNVNDPFVKEEQKPKEAPDAMQGV